MRIEIKTGGLPIKDKDIKVLYILDYAMQISSDRMLKANLKFAISKWKKKIDLDYTDKKKHSLFARNGA